MAIVPIYTKLTKAMRLPMISDLFSKHFMEASTINTKKAAIINGKGKNLVSSGGLNFTQVDALLIYPLGHVV